MASLITELRAKVRALCEDFHKDGTETFTYSSGDQIFTLQEDYPDDVSSVTKNGVALGSSAQWSFDSDTKEVTIIDSLSADDVIVIKYTYYKYSNSEIDEYIRGALVWISVSAYCETDYEMESDDDIFPTPKNKDEDLIALVAAILIKPNYSEYKLPNLTVKYPRTISKDQKIQKLVEKFYIGLGINDILEFD